ncbi:amino acid ABC transporter substrate-binding protein [Desulfobacula toluolica]|uniref:Leu/Ile/Val-binding protein n=1 Tax=Desulfobacula toluolica (strain DSM 7467 / Tol2) TaxID=651182 RepID=K0NFE7_DESTT|nr:amino acid ABC transporter substrate-binding protein [Desulfobacula toluolica]CCK79635.1 Leu/Ile/Val-binding protein [Desulfobacula toluolica Tol2]
MQKKIFFLFFIAIALGSTLIFLSRKTTDPTENRAIYHNAFFSADDRLSPLQNPLDRKTINFGVSISKTGRFSVEGKNVIQGYMFWQEHVNKAGGIKIGARSYRVNIKSYDDKSNIETLKKNITKLIKEDKVDFILGPFSSDFNFAASQITEKNGIIMIASGGVSDSIFTKNQHFTFATQTSASWWFKEFFNLMSQVRPAPKTYALIMPDKLFTRSAAKGVRIWAASQKIQEVYYQIIDKQTDNFTPYLHEMASKQPDIIILTSHYQDAVNFSKQLSKIKQLKPKAVVMTIGPSETNYVQDVGDDSEGMIGIAQWAPQKSFKGPVFGTSRDYMKAFKDEYGRQPSQQNATSSACGVIFQLALEKCTALNSKELINNIRNMDVEIFYGRIKYNSRGMNIGHQMALVQIQQGKMKTIWPPQASESTINYPLHSKY